MKRNREKIISSLLIVLSLIFIVINTYAHSGRTDSRGGHKDNKNKSGLGSYHYHCGGNPAHLHTNGICPYSSSGKGSTSNSSSSSTTNVQSNNIAVTSIQINENIESLKVGESKMVTAIVMPSNATDKSITWKSSDESIATINTDGKIIAKESGIVYITATSSNWKTSTIKIDIKEEPKSEKNNTIKTSANINKDTTDKTIEDNQEYSNPVGEILAIGLLGGAGYWGYNKYKKSK